uniref:MORN repeat-containing protein 2-like n=1 Tax=Phallusia mammillata TaxID=59560 RepID=A0A6F9DLP4_9ASCI|nr:MORN repeat-containing protein 2-like [Phallusia mammillata]
MGQEVNQSLLTGEFMFPNNDHYKGEYLVNEDGKIERKGFGTHKTSSGVVYTGYWENDKMNGNGELVYPTGASYKGEFCDNYYDGSGTYTWPNQCVYKGSFSSGKLKGEGVFYDSQNQKWVGEFHYKAAPALKFKLQL